MTISWLRLLPIGALLLCQLAHAQYSWIDDKGARVFSDRPPPPGTPAARILKAPRGFELPPTATDAPAAAAAAPALPDWKKRELDYLARRVERDKAAREAEAQAKPERDAQCAWARDAKAQLGTARRLEWKNQKGELEFISDEDRTRELARVKQILASCG